MMKIIRHVKLLSILIVSVVCSCEPDRYPTEMIDNIDEISLRIIDTRAIDSKSSYGDKIDQLFTGAELVIYNSTTGALELHQHIDPDKLNTTISVRLHRGYNYDFYVFGNMYKVKKRDSSIAAIDIPYTSSDMQNLIYRMDGSDIDDSYRYETMEELSKWGIPMCWKQLDVNPINTTSLDIKMSRLFSRLRLVIDHSGLSGSSLSDFVHGKVYIKQVNTRLCPFFSTGSKALSPSDVLAQGDYEMSMDGDNGKEYIFYVPENMQGELLPSNIDPKLKTLDNIIATYDEDKASLLTYLEFQGTLNGDAGFVGDATYRFLLGSNTTKNFDVQGNVDRLVELSFNPNSIYDANWKVSYDGLEDKRQFYFSGDLAGRLPTGKMVVVRPSRPGHVNLNIEMPDGTNAISQASLVDIGYEPNSLNDIAWTSNVYSLTHDSKYESRLHYLTNYGITPTYADGKMTFTVTDPSKFVANKSVNITFTFYPGEKTLTLRLSTRDDIVVSESLGRSLTKDFFVGQRRILKFSGFCGDSLFYAAFQPETGPKGNTVDYNKHWKARCNLTSSYPVCLKDNNGDPILPYQDTEKYAGQYVNRNYNLIVYSYYPNCNVYGVDFKDSPGIIYLCSNDVHNDGIVEIPVKISLPYYAGTSVDEKGSECLLPVDGSPREIRHQLYTSYNGEKLSESQFEPVLYDALIKPQRTYSKNCSEWIKQCVDTDDSSIFLFKTQLNGVKIESLEFDQTKRDTIYFDANPATGLFVSRPNYIACNIHHPSLPQDISDEYLYYFCEKQDNSSFGFSVSHNYYEGDMSRVKAKMTGPYNIYICDDGTNIHPQIDLTIDPTLLTWRYEEQHQITQLDSGEKVPGGLVVPYGNQNLVLCVTNSHDGRTMEYDCSFNLIYDIVLIQLPVYPSSGDATIYMMGIKNAKYLKEYAPYLSKANRKWVMKTLNTLEWQDQIASVSDFTAVVDGSTTYPANNKGVINKSGIPRTGYKASYVNPNAKVWTKSLADQVNNDSNYRLICDPYFFNATGEQQNVNSNYSITGSWAIRMILGNTEKQGYIFMDDFL